MFFESIKITTKIIKLNYQELEYRERLPANKIVQSVTVVNDCIHIIYFQDLEISVIDDYSLLTINAIVVDDERVITGRETPASPFNVTGTTPGINGLMVIIWAFDWNISVLPESINTTPTKLE